MGIDKFVYCIETIIFMTYSEIFLISRFKSKFISKIPIIVSLVYIQFYLNFNNSIKRLYFAITLDIIMIFFYYKGNTARKIFVTLTYYAISISIQAGLILLLSDKFSILANFFVTDEVKSLGVFTLNICIMIIILVLIFNLKNKKWIVIDSYILLSLSALPFFTIIIFWHIFPFSETMVNYNYLPQLYEICFLILISNLIIFRVYKLQQTLFLETEEKKSLQGVIQSQIEYFKERNKISNQTKDMAHDFIKTIRMLKYLYKYSPQKVSEYLEEISNDFYNFTNLRYTGNDVVDSIINSFSEKLVDTKIICSSILPPTIFLEDVDIMLLLGNALENAINELSKVQTEDKNIYLDFFYTNDKMEINIENMTNKAFSKTIIKSPNDVATSGRGLKIMASVLEKYNGIILLESKDNIFNFEVLLNNL